MDKIIDHAWGVLLANLMKQREQIRPQMGDEVDLYVPQARLMALAESNPTVPRLLYLSAQSSAQRNSYIIVRKLNMPQDYFWKFAYWEQSRAFNTIDKVINRIFSALISQAKEGLLKVEEVQLDPLRIKVNFSDCVECAGMSGLKHGLCYYHAGTFAGIFSALIKQDLDAFETNCIASGGDSCSFVIGDKADSFISNGLDEYLSAQHGDGISLAKRLQLSLENQPVRTSGNSVDINYLRLVMANTLLSNPQLFSETNFEVGVRYGREIAKILVQTYGRSDPETMIDYYLKLKEMTVEVENSDGALKILIKESSEPVGIEGGMEIVSFLRGEIKGCFSSLLGKEMNIKESRFEGNDILIVLVPKT